MALVVGVDSVVRVTRGNHVVVEVEFDFVGLFLRQLLSVVERANKATPGTTLV